MNRTDEQIIARDVSRAYRLSDRVTKRAQSKPNTHFIYLKVIEDQMGDAPNGDVTRGDIQTLLDNMSTRPGAANMTLIVMEKPDEGPHSARMDHRRPIARRTADRV